MVKERVVRNEVREDLKVKRMVKLIRKPEKLMYKIFRRKTKHGQNRTKDGMKGMIIRKTKHGQSRMQHGRIQHGRIQHGRNQDGRTKIGGVTIRIRLLKLGVKKNRSHHHHKNLRLKNLNQIQS